MSKKPLLYKAFLNILQLPRKIFLIILSPIIFIYQKLISPLLGPRCRYHPSCSNYFVQAITTHGILKGIILGVLRIIRCNPFSGGGFNPVPQKGNWLADVYPNGSPRG
jgi:putative membrane protein insertion efficiency factor